MSLSLPSPATGSALCVSLLTGDAPDPLQSSLGESRLIRATATEDATFIISLPNVAHIAARLLLLAGRFPQMNRGIFDRTHLHFYTRATAEAMLRDASLQAGDHWLFATSAQTEQPAHL